MNIENINKAIAVMQRAQERNSVNMLYWQSTSAADGETTVVDIVNTEIELHACGNKACFAGHIAVSPEWLDTPGCRVSHSGGPIYDMGDKTLYGELAIAQWLNIDRSLALQLIQWFDNGYGVHILYEESWEDVRAEHVIRELTLLKELGHTEYIRLKGVLK